MEIIIGIIVLWFIWAVIKFMGRGKSLVADINKVRMSALRNPTRYTQGFDKYDSEDKIRQSITATLYMELSQMGHNMDDYIPGNWEVTMAFNETVAEIYNLIKDS